MAPLKGGEDVHHLTKSVEPKANVWVSLSYDEYAQGTHCGSLMQISEF